MFNIIKERIKWNGSTWVLASFQNSSHIQWAVRQSHRTEKTNTVSSDVLRAAQTTRELFFFSLFSYINQNYTILWFLLLLLVFGFCLSFGALGLGFPFERKETRKTRKPSLSCGCCWGFGGFGLFWFVCFLKDVEDWEGIWRTCF